MKTAGVYPVLLIRYIRTQETHCLYKGCLYNPSWRVRESFHYKETFERQMRGRNTKLLNKRKRRKSDPRLEEAVRKRGKVTETRSRKHKEKWEKRYYQKIKPNKFWKIPFTGDKIKMNRQHLPVWEEFHVFLFI